MRLMSPYELKIKLELADDRSRFVKEHSLSDKTNVIVTDDRSMHFFDDSGEDITDSVESIENYIFDGCESLKSIIIPDSVESIGDWTFSWCTSLASINIPDSAKSIGKFTFYSCKSLTSISIPDSVESIGKGAFFNCTSLKSIVFKGKTLEEVKSMQYFPWGVEDESVFKVEKNA